MEGRVILLDYGFYLHSSGWAGVNGGSGVPISYTCFNMMLADLYKIGVEPEDIIIVGVDYHGEDYSSWRKQYSNEYKVGRMKLPLEVYQELNELVDRLNNSTEWHFLTLEHLEFDDIASVASRYYKEKGMDVIIISCDCDMEQLWIYNNVKIYSPHKKSKRYKIKPDNFNIYKLLAKKIRKEAKDQVCSEILNNQDYEDRRLIMDLTILPDWVENMVRDALDQLEYKAPNFNIMPFAKMKEKYANLYNDKSKIITYAQSIAKFERKKNKQLKKQKEKRKAKKGEKNDSSSI